MRRLEYVPQLDGLRALAVVAVLLFHGDVSWSSGGVLGVDLFFVVSGYLITALLLGEAIETGSVDFPDFYRRRARRLLPALVGLVAVVVAYAVLWSSREQAEIIRRDALGAVAYVHNWVQVVTDASYFGGFEGPSPLRHLWSLAIEEQWYLVWPVVAWACGRRSRDPRRSVAIAAGALFVGSATWMLILESRGASIDRLYYGTDTRLQAVAIGALLATTRGWRRATPRPEAVARIVAPAALLGVVAMFVLVDGDDRWMYRGGFTLFAMAGAALVAVVAQPGPVATTLSSPPLVAVGRVSYSLYLWHWPIFIGVNPSTTGLDGFPLLTLRFALSFAAAGVSYALVEQPLRRRTLSPRLALGLVGSMLAIAVAAGLGTTGDTAEAADANRRRVDLAEGSVVSERTPDDRDLLVVGDSIGYTFSLYVDLEPLEPAFRKVNGGIIGCGLVEAAGTIGTGFVDDPPTCGSRFEIWDEYIATYDPAVVVVMIGGWEIFDRIIDGEVAEVGGGAWRTEIERHLDTVIDAARAPGRTVLLATIPCFDAPEQGLPGDTAALRNDTGRVDAVNEVLRSRSAASPDVEILDVAGVVCPEGQPLDSIDGVQLRRDGIHYTPEGATQVWAALMDDLNAAVARSAP